jgi:hypothetical protein
MQMLDQKIAPAWPVGQQRKHFLQRFWIDLTALRGARRAPSPGSSGVLGRRSRRQIGQAHFILLERKSLVETEL